MNYRIARNGPEGSRTYGPYSRREVERYRASGHIAATDLVQAVGGDEWLMAGDAFPVAAAPAERPHPGGLPALYPDPPNLKWWVALLLDAVTLTSFFVLWDLVLAGWMRRVDRACLSIYFYAAAAAMFLFSLPDSVHAVAHFFFGTPLIETPWGAWVGVASFVVRLVARFSLRRELMRHFNGPEPIGLDVSWFLTLVFGGLYFQYEMNRVNEVKRLLKAESRA